MPKLTDWQIKMMNEKLAWAARRQGVDPETGKPIEPLVEVSANVLLNAASEARKLNRKSRQNEQE